MSPKSVIDDKPDFDKVWLLFQETDKKFRDTDKKMQDTDKKIKELANLFTTQWGKLIESLVEPLSCDPFLKQNLKLFKVVFLIYTSVS